ncbi:Sjogren's syndrome/scleroderma autoantigen 1 family protein [Haladaptatus sp. DFWS20]|uniref:Sjogren's syndrome/scleroderma autoantigen 1 family protein n=1 Tax=Haladaptatus sp. DFWS20 TaxID=3403467 RepID=UPI003EB878BF
MSDFDKEAEREKLRQQYEAEKEERKSTQRMSELLLQGATMTGKHCDTCGDPIFRQNGTEFCPTCQQQQPAGGAPAAEASADEAEETTAEQSTTEEALVEEATNIEVEETDSQPRRSSQPPESPRQPRQAPPNQSGGSHGQGTESRPTAGQSGAEDLTDARNALVRKLARLATEAEKTNDVGRTRDLLAATREAAEALAALDQVTR